MNHEHFVDADDCSRFPECPCGAVYWTGGRWATMPDRSLYMDALDRSADAVRAGVER